MDLFLFAFFVIDYQLEGQDELTSCSPIGDFYDTESNKQFTNMVQR
jgi:hypothetical protein